MLNAIRTMCVRAASRNLSRRTKVRRMATRVGPLYKRYFSPKQIYEYSVLFDKYDIDRDQLLAPSEFNNWIREEIGRTFQNGDLFELFYQVDKDQDLRISFDEFMEHIGKRFHKVYKRNELIRTFIRFDKDEDGRISLPELKAALIFLGQDGGNPEVTTIFRKTDSDRDDRINYKEFKTMVEVHLKNMGRIFV